MARTTPRTFDAEALFSHPIVWFITGIVLAWIGMQIYENHTEPQTLVAVRESSIKYSTAQPLIDPLISVRPAIPDSPAYAALKQQVQSYITTQESHGLISAAVQFRDINTIQGFTIDPTEQFFPASLYKVVLMIAYYRLAETDPAILQQHIYYAGANNNSDEAIVSSTQLVPGTSYSIEELIEHMIRYSDNNALMLLDHNLTTEQRTIYDEVYGDLGIDPSTVTTQVDSLTINEYPTILATLYNASYLDRSYSEQALELLSQTDFTAGLRAGVPSSITVAQKFGESNTKDDSQQIVSRELHNCGIIYYPAHPYRLCIMTKGSGDNITLLEQTIAQISKIVYTDTATRYASSDTN